MIARVNHKISPKKCRVAVIGGGASGITTAKCLREDNHEPIIFEKSDQIGGIWVFKKISGGTFNSVHLQNSKYSAAFSDYPMPADFSEFPHHTEVLKYLNDYIENFKLRDCIQLNTSVEKITRKDNYWEVITLSREGQFIHSFDAIAVCSGLYYEPKLPNIPGEDNFYGTIIHAQNYKEPSIFTDKKVVIVGNGPSGVDIAVAASYIAKNVFWSFRKNMWILPRYYLGLPIDFYVRRINKFIPSQLLSLMIKWKFSPIVAEHQSCNLLPAFNLKNCVPVVNEYILNRVRIGAIKTKTSISGFQGNRVFFKDKTSVEADIVVYATGYRVRLPFLDSSLSKEHQEGFEFYKHVFHPDLPNCAFIGFVYGSYIFPCAELQARWFSQVLSGEASLPFPNQMRAEIKTLMIKQEKNWIKNAYRSSQISTLDYMDEIASQINARPQIWRHWRIAWHLLTGPLVASQYRLDGPNKWDGAQEWIANLSQPPRHKHSSASSDNKKYINLEY